MRPAPRALRAGGSLFLLATCLATPAAATWSLVAVDPATREVGIAGASCIDGSQVIAGVVPGRGVIAAQAFTSQRGRERGVALLREGASPGAILAQIADAGFDRWGVPAFRLRQYGVAALGYDAHAFTGAWNTDWAGDRQGEGVSVQGNTLYGAEVVEDALAAFAAAGARGAPLAERLLAGLEAGAAAGGDVRCPRARAALSAFLIVARPDDAPARPWLRLVQPPGERPGLLAIARSQLSLWWQRRREGYADLPLAPGELAPVAALRVAYERSRP